MLDFCAEHGIGATSSATRPTSTPLDRVVDGDVRYRAVIDTSTLTG